MTEYNPDTARRFTAVLQEGEGGTFFVVIPDYGKVKADPDRVSDWTFKIEEMQLRGKEAIIEYRRRMRELVGKMLPVIIQEPDHNPGKWRITEIELGA